LYRSGSTEDSRSVCVAGILMGTEKTSQWIWSFGWCCERTFTKLFGFKSFTFAVTSFSVIPRPTSVLHDSSGLGLWMGK
jgi:hypothetical protein